MFPRSFVAGLIGLGTLLTVTTIHGPFTIDENNYLMTVLALRDGRLTVPGTEGLPPTRELLFFDPTGYRLEVTSTPVRSTAPPLYALFGLPFLWLGWGGLVSINTLSFLIIVALVFAHLRAYPTAPETPWIGAITIAAGGYLIEYAQGMWPHVLAAALASSAALMGCRALRSDRARWGLLAGLLAGLAAGVRYQNAFFLGCLGVGLLLFAKRRVRTVAAFALAAALPLATSSIINSSRLGSWNPISKGQGYLPEPSDLGGPASSGFLTDTATMAWARLVDYSARPLLAGPHARVLSPQPGSGAFVVVTAVKKAWLQSSPWMIVALVVLLLCWLPARYLPSAIGPPVRRELRFLSLIVVPTLGMFSAMGPTRTDGLCFNQRYFCELVPLVAVALAWAVEGIGVRRTALLGGGAVGAALAFASLQPHHLAPLRHYLVMYLPLAIAVLFAVLWGLWTAARARGSDSWRWSVATATAMGAALAWSLIIHLGDDLQASRILRHSRWDYHRQLEPYIQGRSAVFASGPVKDALGMLMIDRDVVIAVPGFDQAASTEELLVAFQSQGRRVFILPNAIPRDSLDRLLAGRQVRRWGEPTVLIEVGAKGAAASGA